MKRRLRQTKDLLRVLRKAENSVSKQRLRLVQLAELENRQKNLLLHVGLVNQRKSLQLVVQHVGQVSLRNQKRNQLLVAVRVGLENNFFNS